MSVLDPTDAQIAAEREIELRREIIRLRQDVDAQRRTIERMTHERDFWRDQYQQLKSRIGELCRIAAGAAELRKPEATECTGHD